MTRRCVKLIGRNNRTSATSGYSWEEAFEYNSQTSAQYPKGKKVSCSELSFTSWVKTEWRNLKSLPHCCAKSTNYRKISTIKEVSCVHTTSLVGWGWFVAVLCHVRGPLEVPMGKQAGFLQWEKHGAGRKWRVASAPNFTCPCGWLASRLCYFMLRWDGLWIVSPLRPFHLCCTVILNSVSLIPGFHLYLTCCWAPVNQIQR